MSEKIEKMNVNLAIVNSSMDKVLADTVESDCDPNLITSINSMCEAIKLLSENQAVIVSNLSNNHSVTASKAPASEWIPVTKPSNSYATVANAKKSRTETAPAREVTMFDLSQPRGPSTTLPQQPTKITNPNDPPEVQKFKDVIRDAEKSTLIFNLNMGTVPLLNTDTISKKATLALSTMAAKVENPNSTIPSKDSIAAIDDILSATTGMTFYGSVTKSYKNPKDEASGSFCTVPVRYEFRDRETRIQAESILKTTCKVNCATPYPAVLRECIKQTGEFFRGLYNTNFVRVSVDLNKMSLRVSFKMDKESAWAYHDKLIPIPKDALNVSLRRAPVNFKMSGLIPDNSDPDAMDMGDFPSGSGANSRRLSRKDSPGKSPLKNSI
jgi:hypothetical protein